MPFNITFAQKRWTLRVLFGAKPSGTVMENIANEKFAREYREIKEINFTAIFANKLSNFAMNKAAIEVHGESERAEQINEILQEELRHKKKWLRFALGTGSALLVPYSVGGKLHIDVVPQDRVLISEHSGCRITRVSFLADQIIRDADVYCRWSEYTLDGDRCIIRNKATRNGSPIANMAVMPAWAGIDEEIVIPAVDRPLIGYLKCPIDNRSPDIVTGVPITFGCDQIVKEIRETLAQIAREYDCKEAWVGISKLVLPEKQAIEKPYIYRKLDSPGARLGEGGGSLFEVFSPEIRSSAYGERLLSLFQLFEKQVGTSTGILSPADATAMATATQVRRAMYDTNSIVDDCRDAFAYAMDDVVYAIDALLDFYGIGVSGDHSTYYKWDDGMAKDLEQEFNDLCRGKSEGAVSTAEIRRHLFPDETIEEAEAAVQKIAAENPVSTMFEV